MRVLAIRGENLASLGQPFTIDFEVEPLAGTGLFAITGDTGSGKSTILDALCLALYGAYPRFAESQQDALPDPSGKKLSIPDGGTILRRGTGKGYAEVEFIGHDGLRYRARWEARRAREKPDGNILGASRTLHQVDGANLTLLAQAKTTVQEAVDRLTGLKFEQFCRTVLLPQGEFDAFLMAEKTERADLLEKVTGTEIYTRISKIVYNGTRALREQAAALEVQLSNLGLLSEEEREALEQAVIALQVEVDTKSGEQQTLQGQITLLDNVTLARKRFAEAEQAVRDTRSNAEAAQPDRVRLMALESVEPFRYLHDKLKTSVSQQPAAASKMSDAQTAHQSLTQDAETAQAELELSRAAHAAAEQTFKNYGPFWDEAHRLDTALLNARSEASTAKITATTASEALGNVNQELGSLQNQMDGAQADLESASVALHEQSKLAIVADHFDQIEALFGRHENQTADVSKFGEQKATAEETIATLSISIQSLNAQINAEANLQQRAATVAESLVERLKSSEEAKWLTQQNEVSALQLKVPGLQNLIIRYQTSVGILQTAEIEHERANADINDAEARKNTANRFISELTSQRADIQRNTELAEQSLDQRNAHLRSLLNDGESCPICGATEHPYTAPGTEDSLTDLANSLRRNRSDLDDRIATTQTELLNATKDFTAATGKLENAERNRTHAIREMKTFTEDFAEQRLEIDAICARFALTQFLPETVRGGDDALSLMQQLRANTETLLSAAINRLNAINELRRQLDSENVSAREAQQRLNSARERYQLEQSSLNEAKLAAASASGSITQATQRVVEIEAELSPFLTAADIILETLRETPATVLATLRSHAKEITEFRSNQQALETKLRQLTEQHGRLFVSKIAAAQRSADADSTLTQRKEILQRISDERALLLDGEETNSHRTRINNTRLQAQREFEAVQIKERGLAQRLATAAQQERSASEALATLLQEIQRDRDSYQNECVSLGIEVAAANELLAFPAGEAKTLKTRLDILDQAVRDAETTLEDRRSVLDGLSKEVAEDIDRTALAETLAQINSVITQANQEIGNKQGRLATDDQLRLNAADIRRAADEKAVELATWQQVEDAIGSANGDRFRTFAQSLTLDQLVQLANEHLDNFSKRYQLARSHDADLSLHIIDNDMGEEHRAIRSLSGGERFLVSLSLALSLAGLEGNEFTVDTLFIDEGFGALDEDTLDVAITALETLHSQGRKVGVITHVAAMIESIPVQVKVEKLGGGSSIVRLQSVVAFA